MKPVERVEQAVIHTATAYAAANPMPSTADVIGLILVGFRIGASLDEPTRQLLVEGYDNSFPDGGAARLNLSARLIEKARLLP